MNTIIHNNNKYNYINYYSNNNDSVGKSFPKLKRLKNPIPNKKLFLNNLNLLEKISKVQKIPKNHHSRKI